MEHLTTCQIIGASERASDLRKKFICAQDGLHHAMLDSPWPILFAAFFVLFAMFLIMRAANAPHRTPEYEAKEGSKN